MTSYVLYLPVAARRGDAAALDRAVVVKDGFAFWAFVFSVFWFLSHRLWLGALGVLLAGVALGALEYAVPMAPWASALMQIAFGLYVALEANQIRGWTLRRRGFEVAGAVVARDQAEAEAKLFTMWLEAERPHPLLTGAVQGPATSTATAATPTIAPKAGPVLGLFPEPETIR